MVFASVTRMKEPDLGYGVGVYQVDLLGSVGGEALRVGEQGVFDLLPGRHAAVAAVAAGSSDGFGAAMREYFACAIVHR